MIERLIVWSLQHRLFILIAALALAIGGTLAVLRTPVDAIPDLSDVQVIVKTSYPGQAPQVVQDQVTYPLTTALLAVPGAVTVRGFSFFGDSYVYVIFDDDTDLYWARSRVLEYLSQVAPDLPEQARPQLGPDATGVGWVFLYALIDRTGSHDLAQLRSLQDWFLKFELQSLPGVSEVATVGGMVRQYQISVDPDRLRAYGITLNHLQQSIRRANQEIGASVIEMAEAEYMIRATGYIDSLEDLKQVPLGTNAQGVALLLDDVADISLGPQMRRGIAELNGEGETVGGIVVMRSGANAQATIKAVRQRLTELSSGLPEGVEVVTVHDRSTLIDNAVSNLMQKLIEEFLIVILVCMLFLFHIRSSLVALISLPIGILTAFGIMHLQGINANIMSLGGIAIAIGAMVDGAIVMVENLHKHIERTPLTRDNRWQVISRAATEVGPALFFSLMIITISFLPVFALQAQEGRLFSPLAFTKTWSMAAAAVLAVTLVPVLMGWCVRGRVRSEAANPINRLLLAVYRPVLSAVLHWPRVTVLAAAVLCAISLWPLSQLGSEFMPPLDEGDLMYMPTTHPGLSIGKARELLQQTDRLIKTVPEVHTVFGKAGRADTATDPAPLTMIETYIQFKPRDQWRPGVTPESLRQELDRLVQIPGLSNAWVMPIKTRIDMLATGIRTPVGIKIAGPQLSGIQEIGETLERLLGDLPGTASVYAERVAGGRYLTIDIDRLAAARHGLNIADVQQVIATAIGGVNVTETVEGIERYPVNLRYPESLRNTPEQIALLPVVTAEGHHIPLGDLARIAIEDGPPGIKSENARINGWVFIDIEGVDLGRYVEQARQVVTDQLDLPPGYSIRFSGQYEYLQRVNDRLTVLIPLTLLIIAVLLYMNFRRLTEVLLLLGTLPVAVIGSIWLLWVQDYALSIAVGVGFIALAGLAVETGVIMLVYLNQSIAPASDLPTETRRDALRDRIITGASRRVRPLVMTAATVILGLLPILFGTGTGAEVMSRIAAPMVGGMLSTLALTLLVLPAVFYLNASRTLRKRS